MNSRVEDLAFSVVSASYDRFNNRSEGVGFHSTLRPAFRGALKSELTMLWRELPLVSIGVLLAGVSFGVFHSASFENISSVLEMAATVGLVVLLSYLLVQLGVQISVPLKYQYAVAGDEVLCCRGHEVFDRIPLTNVQEVVVEQDFMDELFRLYTLVFYLRDREVRVYGLDRVSAATLRRLARLHMGANYTYRF